MKHKLPGSTTHPLFLPSVAIFVGVFIATFYSVTSFISAAGVGQGSTLSIVSTDTAQIVEAFEITHGVAPVVESNSSFVFFFALMSIALGFCVGIYLVYRKKQKLENQWSANDH